MITNMNIVLKIGLSIVFIGLTNLMLFAFLGFIGEEKSDFLHEDRLVKISVILLHFGMFLCALGTIISVVGAIIHIWNVL